MHVNEREQIVTSRCSFHVRAVQLVTYDYKMRSVSVCFLLEGTWNLYQVHTSEGLSVSIRVSNESFLKRIYMHVIEGGQGVSS